jgi:cation transport ATPase
MIKERTKSLINIKTNLMHTRERETERQRVKRRGERERTREKKANAWEEEKRCSRSWHRHELESLDLTAAMLSFALSLLLWLILGFFSAHLLEGWHWRTAQLNHIYTAGILCYVTHTATRSLLVKMDPHLPHFLFW